MPLYPQPVSPLPVNPPLYRTEWDLGTTPAGGPYYALQVKPYTSTRPNNTGVFYNYPYTISEGEEIYANQWAYLRDLISQERVRRGRTAYTNANIAQNKRIEDTDYNGMRTALNVTSTPGPDKAYEPSGTVNETTYPVAPVPSLLPSAVRQGIDLITANQFRALVAALKQAGEACTCNCNYCTCNCNYCTCNCNYSCTCNCNYAY